MTANLDTKALRALLKLMENRVRFDDGMESLIAAAPALLDAAEELRSLRAELDVSRSVGSNLYQGAEAVMAERDALRSEVERLREALSGLMERLRPEDFRGDPRFANCALDRARAALRSEKGEVQS